MNQTKKILCSIGIVFACVLFLIPFFCTLILSFSDYQVMRGLFGSNWVGFANIASFFGWEYFTRILSNTLVISILGTVIGAVYVFFAALSIGSMKNQILKGLIATVFAIPAIVPVNLFVHLLPTELLMQPSFLLRIAVSAIDGFRIAGLMVCVAYFIRKDVLKESMKCVLLFIALKLILILSSDQALINSIYHPLTYEILDVFSTYIYRNGLVNADFSMAAAVHIAKVAISVVPAVIACLILVAIQKENRTIRTERSFEAVSVTALIPIGILFAMVATGGSLLPIVKHPMVIAGYINEFLIAFVSALFVAVLAYGLAVLARNSGRLGILVLVLLCLTGNSLIGKYILARIFGVMDTFVGVVFYQFSMISVLALLLYFATYRERSAKKDLSALLIGFILLFSGFWGDFSASMIMTRQRELFPLSLVLREMAMLADSESANGGMLFSTVPYIFIPVFVVCAGFLISSVIKKDS